MRGYLRRTVTVAIFAFAFFATAFLCADTASATVEVQKNGMTPGTYYSTYEAAVKAVNADNSVAEGDNIKFLIDGGTYPGEAPAFEKKINLEITRKGTPSDEIHAEGDHFININNVASVYIHDLDIKSYVIIEGAKADTSVNIERTNLYRRLIIRDASSVSIDGTRQDGSRSRLDVLWILGTASKRTQISKIKGVECQNHLLDSEGYTISYADCDLIDDCKIIDNQIILSDSTVKKFSNTEIIFEANDISHGGNWIIGHQYTTLYIIDSKIDLLEDSNFFAYNREYDDGEPTEKKRGDGKGIAIYTERNSASSPSQAIGTMRNCILYGADKGIAQDGGGSDIGTIDSCYIAGRNLAIRQSKTFFGLSSEISRIKGNTLLFSISAAPIGGEGVVYFEPDLDKAVGDVRIGRASSSTLFEGGKKNLPADYSWRNSNRSLSVFSTIGELRPYINYDMTEFYYLSYDRCRVVYHPGAGWPSSDFDEFYENEREYVGGAEFKVKGITQEQLNYPDYTSLTNPVSWTPDPEGKGTATEAGTDITLTKQKRYDFYPKFTAGTTYKVEFDTGDYGSKVESQQVFNRDVPSKPEDPTHPGADFKGWYLNEACTEKYSFKNSISDRVDTNRTVKLYAKWELHEYTVTFNATRNGGKEDTQKTVTWGEMVEPPTTDPEYVRPEEQHFTGWYKTAKGTTEFDFDDPIKADTIVYACFYYNKSTITIDMDGGTVGTIKSPWKKAADGNIVYKGEVTDRIERPWKSTVKPTKGYMYTYEGLYEDPEFKVPFDFDDEYLVPPSKTYYAKFTPKNYTVKFYGVMYDEYQQDTDIAPIKTESLPYGSVITYEPEEFAASFSGWDPYYMDNSDITPVTNWDGTVIAQEMRLFLNESPKLIFHSDIAGTKVQEIVDLKEGTNLKAFADRKVDLADYNFVGWTTRPKTDGEYHYKETMPDDQKTEEDQDQYPYVGFFDFAGSTMPDRDIHLYPVLLKDRLRVILDTNGGTIPKDYGQALEFTVDINEKLNMVYMRHAENPGYTLDGWYTQSGVKWDAGWGVTPEYCAKDGEGNPIIREEVGKNYRYYTVKLTAVWLPKQIGVYYIGIEGDGGPTQYGTTTLGSTVVLKDAVTVEAGDRIFEAWKDSKGKPHSAKEEFLFDDPDYMELTNIGGYTDYRLIFTAEYRDKEYNEHVISFDAQGGSYVEPITQEEGTEVTAPADPTREGYTFLGWDPEVPDTMPADDMVCVAQWEEIPAAPEKYTISFDNTGDSQIDPITADEGSALTPPADPVKEHYTFTGWTPTFPAVMPSRDETLTGTWEPAIYKVTFDANGGKFGNGNDKQIVSDIYDALLATPEDPTRESYEFSGWDTNVPAHIPGGDLAIKATWTKIDSDDPTPDPEPAPKPATKPATKPGSNSITPSDDVINKAKVDNKLAINANSVSTVGRTKKKTMEVKWKKVTGATNYRLAYRMAGKKWIYVWTGGKNSYTLKGMKKNGLYEFKLQTFKKSGNTWTKSEFGKMNYRLFVITKQKVKAGKKGFTVKVKKVKKATGYEVIYSVKKGMKPYKVRTYRGGKKVKLKVGKLKAKKRYYVSSRPYRIYKGHKYIGVINKAKKVKTKK